MQPELSCTRPLQATLVKFSVEEEKLIAQAHRHGGMEKLLAGPQASRIDPRLHNVLLSGKLVVSTEGGGACERWWWCLIISEGSCWRCSVQL